MIGSVPFGFRLDPDGEQLVPHPGEQQIVTYMQLLRNTGSSYRAIAEELTSLGSLSSNGRPWHYQSVRQILRRNARLPSSPARPHARAPETPAEKEADQALADLL